MKFDTPMVMMLGVVGLGAFAVFRLTKTKSAQPQTTSLPDLASQPIAALKLQNGVRYEGRLALQTVDVPPLAATREQLVQFIQLLGFKDVKVYMTPAELPSKWSELRTGTSSNRWFEGTSTVTVELPRPKQVDRLSGNGTTLISGMTG